MVGYLMDFSNTYKCQIKLQEVQSDPITVTCKALLQLCTLLHSIGSTEPEHIAFLVTGIMLH